MRSREAEVLVERMVAVIEQSHRLQLEMLEMWKALLNVGERARGLACRADPRGAGCRRSARQADVHDRRDSCPAGRQQQHGQCGDSAW